MYREVAERIGEVHYSYGTMIETPRACLLADRLAETAQFFSFGANDLTQMTFASSRDDSASEQLLPLVFPGTHIYIQGRAVWPLRPA